MAGDRGPWIVAGMHRSGTSLVASALAGAGIDLGSRLLPGDEHNRPGYFEDLDFLELDRRILAAACPPGDGGHPDWGWTESERLDEAAFDAHRAEARALVSARAGRGCPWGFKDPRATLLLDFWLSLASEARFVLCYRLPWQVADSLQRLGADVFLRRPDYAYRVWAFYNSRLLDFHRRYPERTALLSVDAAVDAGARFAAAVGDALGLEVPPGALAGRFDRELFRRLPADDPLVALAGAVHAECLELLDALDREAALPATGLWRREAPRARHAGEPRVTVVIPCFDDGELLVEAVASAERAVELPHELIVVDDGSRDPRTGAILDLLAGAGYDVRRRPHAGVAAARNHGFEAARAPFVVPLDADNRLLPGFVERALSVLDREPRVAAVYGDRIEFGARRGRVEVGVFDLHRLVSENYVDTCAVVRREAWRECGGYDQTMPLQGWEDWELWLSLVERGWVLHRLPDPAFEYRVRPDSMLRALEASPDLPEVAAHVLARHQALYLRSHQGLLAALRAAQAGGAAAAAELAKRAAELEAVRRERDALDRQRRALHTLLETWRERLAAAESARPATSGLLARLRRSPEAGTEPVATCVIGATGGSGTRVFARLAERGGLLIGRERNEFEDALPIERFLDRWLVPFWQAGGGEPPHAAPPGMDDDLRATLAGHLPAESDRDGPHGWKSARSLYVLPFLAQRLPALRFLHVVRDGRDMAFSANQRQLARYGDLFLSSAEREWDEAERSIALWSRINLWAAGVGERLGPPTCEFASRTSAPSRRR